VQVVFSDEEIVRLVAQAGPDLVPIDAPLTLPAGRTTIQDRSGGHFRPCDLALRQRGIRFFPVTLGPMRLLTERGMAIEAQIQALGYRVAECYPGASQDLWGLPRQHRDLPGLLKGLAALGVKGLAEPITGDALDAATAALTGRWFLQGKGEIIGGEEGIILPVGGGPLQHTENAS
jgi:predicted nuclease with RNAse H fold